MPIHCCPASRVPFLLVMLMVLLCLAGNGHAALPADRIADLDTNDFRQVISQAKEKVFPAVIYIKCLRESMEGGKKLSLEVSGSGVIISDTGLALTNWHVVDKATSVRCLLSDGRGMDAKVLGTDKDTDLAVIQLQLPTDPHAAVPFASLGDSTQLTEGEFVMAMGAPWGLNRSVSIGIVSCTNRYLPENSEYSLWLQTDASISPGNSGGPLVNTQGQVIGLNTRGSMAGGDMGFAVPSDTISQLVPQLQKDGQVNWSWTGLQLQPLRDFDRNIMFDATEGVIVASTDPESPARHAGVQPQDRLVAINGQAVTAATSEALPAVRRRLGMLPKGTPVKLDLVRAGKPMSLSFTPREKGKVEGEQLDCPRWNMTVKTINQFDNADLFFYKEKGVFIFGVKYPGNAATAGLRPQDIVTKIDTTDIETLDDLKAAHKAAIDNLEQQHKVKVTVLRGGLNRQFVLDFSRDYDRE